MEHLVNDFREFCDTFNIISNKEAGKDGSDEELIFEELEMIENQKWLINFVENKTDGYFKIQLIE